MNGCYRVYPEHQSKLKCPHVGYVSAFAEDVFTPGSEVAAGLPACRYGPDFVVISCRVVSFCVRGLAVRDGRACERVLSRLS